MNLKLWKFGDLKTEVTLHVHNVSTQMDIETSSRIQDSYFHSKILFSNGYAFDKLFLDVIASSIECAIDAGTSIFFILGLVEDLSHIGNWMNRVPLSMLYGSTMLSL